MDAALDLCSIENLEIPPGQRALVQTGIAVQLPEGTYGKISPHSGLALKQLRELRLNFSCSAFPGAPRCRGLSCHAGLRALSPASFDPRIHLFRNLSNICKHLQKKRCKEIDKTIENQCSACSLEVSYETCRRSAMLSLSFCGSRCAF